MFDDGPAAAPDRRGVGTIFSPTVAPVLCAGLAADDHHQREAEGPRGAHAAGIYTQQDVIGGLRTRYAARHGTASLRHVPSRMAPWTPCSPATADATR